MLIHIIESYKRFGGRQITMLSGFTDYFIENGHRVKVFDTGAPPQFRRMGDMLRVHNGKNLSADIFTVMVYSEDWGELFECDMLLTPYPHIVNKFPYKPECRVVAWNIAETPEYEPYVDKLWTNSHTTKKKLGLKHSSVVYAPHSYLSHRMYSKPWADREIDVISVCSVKKRRETEYIISSELQELQWLHANKYKVLGLFIVRDGVEEKYVAQLGFEHYVNLPREYVSAFMANSKILLHQSPLESCSLTIFEGLNAGCYPVIREAGACREQLGDVGYVYSEFHEAFHQIQYILDAGYDEWTSIEQGMKFDRVNNKTLTREMRGL